MAARTDAAGVVRIRVHDTERGIPADRLGRIVAPLVRVGRATAGEPAGVARAVVVTWRAHDLPNVSDAPTMQATIREMERDARESVNHAARRYLERKAQWRPGDELYYKD